MGDLFDLTDRVAVVTGASSGLGAAVSRTLADAGARVALVARRADRLDSLAQETGGVAITCDVSDADAVRGVVPKVVAAVGAPEILVNAAGTYVGTNRAEEEELEGIRRTIEVNVIAPFLLCQAVYPHMVEVGRGAIVNVSSISGRVGIKGIPQASYATSKAALSGLTADLSMQWARHSIRVNTVAPGYFRSEMTAPLYETERTLAWLRQNTPLPYDGEAEDVVGAVLWLVSDAGRYVTGQTIVVDGGWTAK